MDMMTVASSHGCPARLPKRTSVDRLYAENMALIGLCLRRFPLLTGEDREEAFGAAMLGLWKAAQGFDPSKGFAFSTYATECIRHAILNYLARQRTQRRLPVVSLSAIVGDGDSELSEILPDLHGERPGQRLLAQAGFEALISGLPAHQAALLRALFYEGREIAEIAAEMGVSHVAVYQKYQSARRAVRRNLSREQATKQEEMISKQKKPSLQAASRPVIVSAEPPPYRSPEVICRAWAEYHAARYPGEKPTLKWLTAKTRLSVCTVSKYWKTDRQEDQPR